MKLQARFKKTLALTAVATTLFSCMPAVAFASDYTGHWAEETINEWKNKGVIDGYEDGSFKPKQEVTRAELAKMLTKVFGLTYTEGAAKYNDVAADAWYAQDIKVVSAAGLMLGESGNFRPSEIATREEAAYAIATAYHVTGQAKSEYKDQADISSFAVEAVNALTANGYMNGYPEDGTFRPQGSLTRAEAVTMLDKITADIINTAGTYTQDTQGNVVVNAKNVILKDMVINGNLYLAEGIGEGDVTLDGTTVTGNIIVEGGGINSVSIKGKSKIKNIVVSKAGKNPVRLAVAGTVVVTGTVEITSPTVIEGTAAKLPAIIVNGAETLEIKGTTTVETITVEQKVAMTLAKESKVKEVTVEKTAEGTKLAGNGTIEKLHTEAEKVTVGSGLTIDKTTTGEGVTLPTIDKPAGGGGGGGGGGGSSQQGPAIQVEEVRVHSNNMGPEEEVGYQIIKITNNTIDATIYDNAIRFPGEGLTQEFTGNITKVSAHLNTVDGNKVVVSVPGIGSTEVELTDAHEYTIQDLFVLLDGKKEVAEKLINQFEKDGQLSETSAATARDYLDRAFAILERNKDDQAVPVSSILVYAQKVEGLIRELGVKDINAKLGAVLQLAGVTIEEQGNDIVVSGQVLLKSNGFSDTKVTLQLTFK